MSMSLYRLIASIGRTQAMTNMLGIQALIAILILGGFIISKGKITAIKLLNNITKEIFFFVLEYAGELSIIASRRGIDIMITLKS
jgi:hypothetical protein